MIQFVNILNLIYSLLIRMLYFQPDKDCCVTSNLFGNDGQDDGLALVGFTN